MRKAICLFSVHRGRRRCAGALLGTLLAAVPLSAQPDPDLLSAMRYRMVGPSRGGRVTAVAGHRSHPGRLLHGCDRRGGLEDHRLRHNWRPISRRLFPQPLDRWRSRSPRATRTSSYVSTGSDGLRSNVIMGKGVYRSDDAGATWKGVGPRKTPEIRAPSSSIPPTPTPPGWRRSATRLRRTRSAACIGPATGGKAGNGSFSFPTGPERRIWSFRPGDPDTIYASMWETERKPGPSVPAAWKAECSARRTAATVGKCWKTASPGGLRGKSDLAVSAADPARVYVLIEGPGG